MWANQHKKHYRVFFQNNVRSILFIFAHARIFVDACSTELIQLYTSLHENNEKNNGNVWPSVFSMESPNHNLFILVFSHKKTRNLRWQVCERVDKGRLGRLGQILQVWRSPRQIPSERVGWHVPSVCYAPRFVRFGHQEGWVKIYRDQN